MHAFRVQIGDDANFVLLVVDKLTFAVVTLHDGLCTGETGIKRPCLNGVCVKHRCGCRHRDGDKARHATASALIARARTRWVGNSVRNQATNGVVGTAGATGSDLEEPHILCRRHTREGKTRCEQGCDQFNPFFHSVPPGLTMLNSRRVL